MDDCERTIEELVVRLRTLEHRERALRRVVAAGVVLISSIMLLRQADSTPTAPALEAETFVVKDANGKPRAAFGLGADGRVGLEILDRKGAKRIILAVSNDGDADLALVARNGTSVLMADAGATKAGLSLINGKTMGADFTADEGQIALQFAEKTARRLSVGMDEHGDPSVILFGHTGEPRAILLDTAEQVGISFADTRKTVRVAVGLDLPGGARAGPELVTFDQNGDQRWKAP